jgi:transposase
MLSEEQEMEVLEAYDLVKSYRGAAELCGVDHHTVARVVLNRAAGLGPGESATRPGSADAFVDKIEEWVRRSHGKIRADVVHDRLVKLGYTGSERTTRRVVAHLKQQFRREHHRVYKPWIPEPGLWLQYDFGDGPRIGAQKMVLFCAWLAWSRFRVILPLLDKSLPSVIAALDTTFRMLGGAPSYLLTDNEKTITDHHIAGVAVRNQVMLSAAIYYGVSLSTCVPYDPESKGGSESSIKVAKADLVPTEANLLDDYDSLGAFEAACQAQMEVLNGRVHAVTRRVPNELLAVERAELHAIPASPYTAAFGESRLVGWSATISYYGARYSVPDRHCDSRVWVRRAGEEVVIVSAEDGDVHEIARHELQPPGGASIKDEHYTRSARHPGERVPKPRREEEKRFLDLGEGAARYLIEAGALGARRIEARMRDAVALAVLHGSDAVERALGLAAFAGRFEEGDLESILVHSSSASTAASGPPEQHSLQRGTAAWSALGLDTSR